MADTNWNFLNYEGLEYYDNKSEVRTDEKIAVETERAKNAENNIQTQLNTKAPLASPTLTGTPKAPTASAGTNTTQIATTAFVQTAVSNLVDSAPETLNTLNELSAALGDDPNFATTIATQLGNKVDKVDGKGLSTNDYTTTEKTKLSGIATGAEVNQNTFSNVKVGSTTIAADSKTDTLTLVGSNVTLTPDATNDKITIGITSDDIASALGYVPSINNTTYGVATTSSNGLMSKEDKSKLNNVDAYATNIPFILGTQTATTGTWTGTTSEISSLVDGQTIRYWLPYDGSGNATLNLTLSDGTTTTGAVNVYWKGTTRLATHYPAGSVITLTYRKTVSIAGSGSYTGWWADADYDANQIDRIRYQQNIKCGTTAIVTGNIIVGTGGVYNHLKAGTAFDITYPILCAGAAIAASATGNNNYLVLPVTITTTQSITLTTYKPVFIKGSLSGTTFTPVSTTPLTQTIPTSEDGYEYILLGTAYSTTALYLLPDHPIFAYKDGVFGQVGGNNSNYDVASTSANGLMSSADKTKLNYTNIAYATCSTEAATAAKIITISGNTNWKLTAGSMITVKFSYTNTASNPTFNVNNTGAKSVWYNTSLITTSNLGSAGTANRPMNFVYDGTQYVFIGWSLDNNSDTKATQTNTTTAADYRVVLSTNANDTTETNALRKSANFTANPSTGAFYAKGYDRIDITNQTLDLDTLTLSNGSPQIMRYINRLSGGATNITNIPVTANPFILDVELIRYSRTSDYVTKQTFNSIGDKTHEYVRYCTNGTWDSWTKRVFTDNNTTYSAATTSANGLMTSTDKAKLNYTNIAYGTCSTDAATAAKVVTISGNTNWALTVGSIIVVKFTVTNTASSVTLNVNNTGAKSIWYNNGVYTGGSSAICGYVNRYTTYMYDGTNWVWISNGTDNNTTYSPAALGQGYGTCATAEATVAKVVTLSSYSLVTGGIVAVKFTYAVPASATMNINSKGAKSIYYRGAAITSGIIKAGDIGVFMYNGTQYHLLTVDRDNNTTYTLNYDKDNSELQLKTGDSVVSAVTIVGGGNGGGNDDLKIVTWADGTYDEIKAMLDAHYAGTIDISDYWSVGDVRTIPLSAMSATGVGESQSAQNAEVVIIGFGHDNLVSPVNGKSKSAVSLQLKNSLKTTGYMYSGYEGTSYSLWDGSPRRTWCNSVFKNALPAELVNLIKTVTKKTWRYAYTGYESYRTQQTTNDDCFLISEFEVYGKQGLSTTYYGTVGEDGTQYEYYKTTSNRIKYLGVSGTSASHWWLRSSAVYENGGSHFHYVLNSGSVNNHIAYYTYGVAPGFCI